jgi:hypothetical protein
MDAAGEERVKEPLMYRFKTLGRCVPVITLILLGLFPEESLLQAQTQEPEATAEQSGFSFGTGITFGVNSFPDEDSGEVDTYQLLALRPDFGFGGFGIGLDLPVNYRFTGGDGNEFEVRREDWVPDSDRTFLEVYLPKFRYVRYGNDGDLFYARFGGLPGATLGSGFIMNSYSNELFTPHRRIFGGVLEVDGQGVGFPYVGVETMVGNVAAWDLFGGRLFVRPLATTGIPLISALQLGSTFVMDRDPYYFSPLDSSTDDVIVWGADLQQPVLDRDLISLALLGDVAFQKDRRGGMAGFTGRAARFLLYGGQLRFVDANFVPQFFDYSYDVRRDQRYAIYNEDVTVPGSLGWLGRLGFAFFEDDLVFDTSVSGSFDPQPGSYPELRSVLTLGEGVIPGFSGLSAQGSYTKFDLRRWDDLGDLENALIGARFNIRSGPVVISLIYDLTYDPYASGDPWIVTSGLESTISF